jgi:transposase
MTSNNPSSKRYPPELKERAVRMVLDLQHKDPGDHGVISRVARQLGVGTESLRTWVKQAEVDAGSRPGLTTQEHAELVELRKEVKELRRSNDILQAAASFMSNPRLCGTGRRWRPLPLVSTGGWR